MGIPKFCKQTGRTITFNSDGVLNFYIPEKYFDLKACEYVGDYIQILGILDWALEDKNGKLGKLHRFYAPTKFMTKPSDVKKLKEVKLTKYSKVEDYRVLRYVKDDVIIQSIDVPKNIINVETMINAFIITGNIPNTIPYDKLQEYAIDNMEMNGKGYGLNLQMWGIIFSEICRDSKDPTKAFRLNKSTNMHDYQSISIKKLSQMDSPYSAIGSENFDESIVRATLSNKESNSPLEKLLTNEF